MACKYFGSLLFEKVFADREFCLQLWRVCASYGVLTPEFYDHCVLRSVFRGRVYV